MAFVLDKEADPAIKFDGFDPKIRYQMVPVQGTRKTFKVSSEADTLEVKFDPAGIARFGARSFAPPAATPIEDFRMLVPPRTVAKFEIFGIKHGNTTINVKGTDGKSVGHLLVSVKKEIPKTYSLVMLRDAVHVSPWSEPGLRPMMRAVEDRFLNQANIRFSEMPGGTHQLNINDKNLGNTIILDKIIQPENKEIDDVIEARTPAAAKAGDFTIYFTWDVKLIKMEIVGLNRGKPCYIAFNATNPGENFLSTAHELGHGLGLDHTGIDTLMAGDGVSRSSRIQQFEIDTINKSDEDP